MNIKEACENYFHGLNDLLHFRFHKNDKKFFSILKIISYFTVIIPLTMGFTYAGASLFGRVSNSFTKFQDKIHFIAMQMLAKKGDPKAKFELGVMYLYGQGVATDLKKGLGYIRDSHLNNSKIIAFGETKIKADENDRDAAFKLSQMYKEGEGVKLNLEMAFLYCRRAATQGLPAAQCELGNMYFKGVGVRKDLEMAEEYYKDAIKQNYIDALNQLGLMYYTEDDEYIPDLALDCFTKGANLNHPAAQYNLGVLLSDQRYGFWNRDAAIEWFKKAAAQGHLGAQTELKKV